MSYEDKNYGESAPCNLWQVPALLANKKALARDKHSSLSWAASVTEKKVFIIKTLDRFPLFSLALRDSGKKHRYL